jgi:multiple sugar transport system substrate-binding protein
VRKSIRASEEFEQLTVQRNYAEQIPYISYVPRVPFIFEFYRAFDTAVEKALRGSVSPKEALDEAAEEVNEILERQKKMRQEAGL